MYVAVTLKARTITRMFLRIRSRSSVLSWGFSPDGLPHFIVGGEILLVAKCP